MSRRAVGVGLVLGSLLATGLSVSLITRDHVVFPWPIVNRATDGCVEAWNRTVEVVTDGGLIDMILVPRLLAAAKETRRFDGELAAGMEHLARGRTVADWQHRLRGLLGPCEERGWSPPPYVDMDWLSPGWRPRPNG